MTAHYSVDDDVGMVMAERDFGGAKAGGPATRVRAFAKGAPGDLRRRRAPAVGLIVERVFEV